jgi:hypothetical protein
MKGLLHRIQTHTEHFRNFAVSEAFGSQMEAFALKLRQPRDSLQEARCAFAFEQYVFGTRRGLGVPLVELRKCFGIGFHKKLVSAKLSYGQIVSDTKNPLAQVLVVSLGLKKMLIEFQVCLLRNFVHIVGRHTQANQIPKQRHVDLLHDRDYAILHLEHMPSFPVCSHLTQMHRQRHISLPHVLHKQSEGCAL